MPFQSGRDASSMIEGTLCVQDPLLRRSAMHALAMAYCGSGNNRAVRRLLHVAVSAHHSSRRRARDFWRDLGNRLFSLAVGSFDLPAPVQKAVGQCLSQISQCALSAADAMGESLEPSEKTTSNMMLHAFRPALAETSMRF